MVRSLWRGELVVDLGDDARGVGAEGVLCRRVRVTAGRQETDVRGGAVGGALHLVQRATVGRVERSDGAVRGDTWRAGGAVDVARERSGGLRRADVGQETGDERDCR